VVHFHDRQRWLLVAEGLEQAVEKDLGFSLFVPSDVRSAPGGELRERPLRVKSSDVMWDELNRPAGVGQLKVFSA
jgi:hypothetical protein